MVDLSPSQKCCHTISEFWKYLSKKVNYTIRENISILTTQIVRNISFDNESTDSILIYELINIYEVRNLVGRRDMFTIGNS